jgi:hypothetical protein
MAIAFHNVRETTEWRTTYGADAKYDYFKTAYF